MSTITIDDVRKLISSGDYEQLYSLCVIHSEKGDEEALRILGWVTYLGIGVEQNEAEGLEWMKKAAHGRNAKALFGLGRLLEDLDEYELAKSMYQESVEKGYLPSKYRLAQMIRYGVGCDANKKLALSLFKEAGKKGHFPSQAARATMLRKGEAGLWGIITGLFLTIYVALKTVGYSFYDPYSEKFTTSFPMEFNLEMTKRKHSERGNSQRSDQAK